MGIFDFFENKKEEKPKKRKMPKNYKYNGITFSKLLYDWSQHREIRGKITSYLEVNYFFLIKDGDYMTDENLDKFRKWIKIQNEKIWQNKTFEVADFGLTFQTILRKVNSVAYINMTKDKQKQFLKHIKMRHYRRHFRLVNYNLDVHGKLINIKDNIIYATKNPLIS